MRLAPGLSDDRAYLAALRHRAGGGDLETIDEVVAAYERLGEPEAGLAFLDSLSSGPHAREVMERNAQLAERAQAATAVPSSCTASCNSASAPGPSTRSSAPICSTWVAG